MESLKFMTAEWKVLRIGFLHAFFSGFGQTFFLSLFGSFIIEEYELNRSLYGAIYSVATLLSALTMPIPGAWIDHWQLKNFSTLSGFLLAFACFLFSWSPNLIVLGMSLYLMRLSGQGLLSHINGTTMSRYFGSHRGKALSLSNLGYPLSEALVPFLTYLIVGFNLGWRVAPSVMGGLVLCIFIPLSYQWISRNSEINTPPLLKKESSSHFKSNDWNRHQALKHPFIYLILPIYFGPPFFITGLFIQQSSLSEVFNWSLSDFGLGLFWFSLFRFGGSLLSGPILDYGDANTFIFYYMIPIILGCLCTGLGASPSVLFAMCGLTAGAGGSVKTALLNEVYGSSHLGAIRSFTTSVMAVSTGISPLLFGLLLDQGLNFKELLIGSSLLLSLAIVLAGVAMIKFHPVIKT